MKGFLGQVAGGPSVDGGKLIDFYVINTLNAHMIGLSVIGRRSESIHSPISLK